MLCAFEGGLKKSQHQRRLSVDDAHLHAASGLGETALLDSEGRIQVKKYVGLSEVTVRMEKPGSP